MSVEPNYIPIITHQTDKKSLSLWYRFILGMAFFVIVVLIWAALTDLEEFAITYGKLQPEIKTASIQHLEGGIVDSVLVKPGQTVLLNQTLVSLNKLNAQSELAQLKEKATAIQQNVKRIQHFLSLKSNNEKIQTILLFDKEVLANDKDLLLSEIKTFRKQIAVSQQQIANLEQQKIKTSDQLKTLEDNMKIFNKELKMYQALTNEGHYSKRDYYARLREMNQFKGDKKKLQSELSSLNIAKNEALSKQESLVSNFEKESYQKIDKYNETLAELTNAIKKYQDKLNRLNIKTPIKGVVKEILVAEGNVVKPGGNIITIVPSATTLEAMIEIEQRDIGKIKVGDTARIKVLAFDFTEFGTTKGKIQYISKESFEDKKGRSFFKALLTIEASDKRYLPGMSIQADILLGQKSVLSYFLKPLRVIKSDSFREQ